jgi:hypothetical protein
MRRFQLHYERIPNEIVINPEQTPKQIMITIGGFSNSQTNYDYNWWLFKVWLELFYQDFSNNIE